MSIRSGSVVIGAFKDGGAGIRVAQPGYDANANPVDNSKLIFSSDWAGSMPIHAITTPVRVALNQTVTVNFPPLGYIPFAFGMFKFKNDANYMTLANEFDFDSGAGWVRRMLVRDGQVLFSQSSGGLAADFFAVIYRLKAFGA